MPKFTNDIVMDGALDIIINNASKLIVCEGQPASYTAANTVKGSGGNKLGEIAIDSADFTKSDGDVSGRKLTVAAQSGIPITDSGDADHIAIVDDTNSRLLHVTDMSLQPVSSGGSADTQAYDEEFADPS